MAGQILDLFEHSPYFAEELIRTPELVDEMVRASIPLYAEEPAPVEMAALRRWFRRGMMRIQTESICGSHPIFETLARTSELADAVIARAYQIAIAETRISHPPQNPAYQPVSQMWVIALGRLGLREFDIGSDADLVFVLSDSSAAELQFWTRVAEHLVAMITAYTGGGVLFAVDTRLRPNGGGGPLVQTASAVTEYFARTAEAWEGITYMKSRAVAGDPEERRLFCISCRRWIGGATGKAGARAPICGRCVCGWKKSKGLRNLLKRDAAVTTISIFCSCICV